MTRRTSTLIAWAAILGACAVSIAMNVAHAQDSFTIETTAAADGKVVNKLTWATSPAGGTCTASGSWTGTKAGSGSETLPAAAPPLNYALECTWPSSGNSAALSWVAPTTNTDGSALAKCALFTDTGPCLAKYRICRGSTATTTTDCRDHNFPAATTANWTGLAVGTHWFGVKAVTGQGVESALSNTASKTVTAPKTYTASVGVKQPSAATGFAVE